MPYIKLLAEFKAYLHSVSGLVCNLYWVALESGKFQEEMLA